MNTQTLFLESTGLVIVRYRWSEDKDLIISEVTNVLGGELKLSEEDMQIIYEALMPTSTIKS